GGACDVILGSKHWRDSSHIKGLLEHQPFRVQEGEDDLFNSQFIQDAKYEAADSSIIASNQTHLTKHQREKLNVLLQKHSKLFDGTLRKYPHSKVHLELKPGSVPIHAKPYPVPRIHQRNFC
ncbi:MAG: hypothetical protein ACREOZ_04965, partial [Gloeomargaritales cyanobacterium]